MRSLPLRLLRLVLCSLAIAAALASAALAQAADDKDLSDVLGNVGTADVVKDENAPGTGSVFGRVYDGESGAPISGASVILEWPKPADGSEPHQEVRVTEIDGSYEFTSVPPGVYELTFIKAGYRASKMTGLEVQAGQDNQADFPLPPTPSEAEGGNVLELDEFVVEQSVVNEMMNTLELRMESNQQLNIMSAEDLSKYASADVADALKRVAGVNIVEGQFAIIRGLEDRYSSTLFNGAPVPSPDPDRQSIQLDLFPSEVVSNLVVAKTFGPELPSNSSGGNIDIVTSDVPDSPFEIKLFSKGGINENAYDRFLQFESGSNVGKEIDGRAALDQEFGGFLGGRVHLLGREIRYKGIANWGTKHGSEEGYRETRQPDRFEFSQYAPAGDLAYGDLSLSGGLFDQTLSKYDEQLTFYAGLGLDLDKEGTQKIDFSWFWTRKDSEAIDLRENGYLPGFDYQSIVDRMLNFSDVKADDFRSRFGGNASLDAWIVNQLGTREFPLDQPQTLGSAWYSSFAQSNSFEKQRQLTVYQLNGQHDAGRLLDGLSFSWAANYATTAEDESSLGARMRYEPCNFYGGPLLSCPGGANIIATPNDIPTVFPMTPQALGPGSWMVGKGVLANEVNIDETQYFGRFDGRYEASPFEWLGTELTAGYWYETATRNATAAFLDPNNLSVGSKCRNSTLCTGNGTQFVIIGDTMQELGDRIFKSSILRDSNFVLTPSRDATTDASRDIQALYLGGKATFWDRVDLLGGARLEDILIESKNNAFQNGSENDGTTVIFPSKWLMFDRYDNTGRREIPRSPPYNDQILGIDVPVGPCRDLNGNPRPGTCVDLTTDAEIQSFLNGKIDERKLLPAIGLTYRALDWLTLRGNWSKTVARPSFREMGYYVSAKPGTDDLFIGNPQLGLSDVESWDLRAEALWGDVGDLFAVSLFYKTIDDPVEQIIIKDPKVLDLGSLSLYRTFFNNPNQARLKGIETELRKNLGFLTMKSLGVDLWFLDFLNYLSIGGNFTWIDAQVKRSPFEEARAQRFFGNSPTPTPFHFQSERRLYNQPKWIANADLTFDQPDWGTKLTLAYFNISDVLDAAGGATYFDASIQQSVAAYTLDRYIDQYYQLDLVLSQEIWKGFALKATAKNLTDSTRGVIYDSGWTRGQVAERKYRVGRDYSLELSWKFSGPNF